MMARCCDSVTARPKIRLQSDFVVFWNAAGTRHAPGLVLVCDREVHERNPQFAYYLTEESRYGVRQLGNGVDLLFAQCVMRLA